MKQCHSSLFCIPSTECAEKVRGKRFGGVKVRSGELCRFTLFISSTIAPSTPLGHATARPLYRLMSAVPLREVSPQKITGPPHHVDGVLEAMWKRHDQVILYNPQTKQVFVANPGLVLQWRRHERAKSMGRKSVLLTGMPADQASAKISATY